MTAAIKASVSCTIIPSVQPSAPFGAVRNVAVLASVCWYAKACALPTSSEAIVADKIRINLLWTIANRRTGRLTLYLKEG